MYFPKTIIIIRCMALFFSPCLLQQLDKVIIAACCCLAVCCATPTAQVADSKEVPRTTRNVFQPPYYNNGHYYNSPWNSNYNYNNYYHPYRPSHYSHSRIPIAGGAINPNDYRSPVLYSNDIRNPDGSYFYE